MRNIITRKNKLRRKQNFIKNNSKHDNFEVKTKENVWCFIRI